MPQTKSLLMKEPQIKPPVYPGFIPVSLGGLYFNFESYHMCNTAPTIASIAFERENGISEKTTLYILPEHHPNSFDNFPYLETEIANGLAMFGAKAVHFSGPKKVGEELKQFFTSGRHWLVEQLCRKSYGSFKFKIEDESQFPKNSGGRGLMQSSTNLENIVGFDLGASDVKIIGVRNGKIVYHNKIDWDPKGTTDPEYHYGILKGLLEGAANSLCRVDAFGGSSSGVWVGNRLKIGNLARTIGEESFNKIFDRLEDKFHTKFVIVNDGGVSALAGYMLIPNAKGVLGISFGSHEGGGYVHPRGVMDSRLYEVAFTRVDRNPNAPVCKWSNLSGIGGEYFSQIGVDNMRQYAGIKLAEIKMDEKTPLPERLVAMRELAKKGDERAVNAFKSIGVVLGYSVPSRLAYCKDASHVLLLGRVMKEYGGQLICEEAQRVLDTVFKKLNVSLVNTESQSYASRLNRIVVNEFDRANISPAEFMQAYAATRLVR